MRTRVVVLLVCAVCVICVAQSAKKPAKAEHVVMPLDKIKWEAPPAGMVTGTPQLDPGKLGCARLQGDPMKPGPFTIALACSHAKIAPHWHPTDENFVVVKGNFAVGSGDKFDEAALHALPTGAYAFIPKLEHHFGECKDDVQTILYGMGPFKINFISADGAKKKAAGK